MITPFPLLRPVVCMLLLVTQSYAQTKQVTVNASVPEVLNLTVDVTVVGFSFAVADYDGATGLATKVALKATTFRVETNRDWRLSVRAGDAFFAYRPAGTDADPKKPTSALAVRTGAGAYLPFAGVAELTVTTGGRGGIGKAGNVIPVDYQMKSSAETDPPGEYLLTLTYTLVSK